MALFEGDLAVADLPEAWDAKMEEYLGIVPANDARGILQDTHWAIGYFGYFPSYTVGNVLSVQLFEAAVEERPEIMPQMERGEFDALLGWLRENIHRHGKKYEPDDLISTRHRPSPRPRHPTSNDLEYASSANCTVCKGFRLQVAGFSNVEVRLAPVRALPDCERVATSPTIIPAKAGIHGDNAGPGATAARPGCHVGPWVLSIFRGPGWEVTFDPAHSMLDQFWSVEQVGRSLPDRPARSASRLERYVPREVPDVVLPAGEALIGKGTVGGIDVGERPPDALAAFQDRVAVNHAALIRNLCDGLRVVHEGNGIQRRRQHRDLAPELDQFGVGRADAIGVVVRVGSGDFPGKRPDGHHPGSGCPL